MRYLIGGTLVFASLIKIKGLRFTATDGIDHPIHSAWHFFETMFQSGLYWKFIGLGQLIAGFLLMTQRVAKLGALISFTILLNVFVITLSYYFAYTPVVTGLMLSVNVGLILWDWNELKVLLNFPPSHDPIKRLEHDKVWEITGLLLFAFTFFYRLIIDDYSVFLWFSICLLIGTFGFWFGLKKREKYP